MIKSVETERLISRTDDLVRYAEKHGSAVSGFFDAASVSVVGEHLSRLGLAARVRQSPQKYPYGQNAVSTITSTCRSAPAYPPKKQ